MFDISFAEILFIALIALVVIGPKRLPETIRTLGLWLGRLKRSLANARQELEREVGMDDIRRQLHNEEVLRSLEKQGKSLRHDLERDALAPDKPSRSDDEKPRRDDTDSAGPKQQ